MEGLQRRARDPVTGKTYLIDQNITYDEWKKQIDSKYGKGTVDLEHKKYTNLKTDKEQYKRYKNVLGKEKVPKTFANFQDLKYNNVDEWKKLKVDYFDVRGIYSERQAKEYINNVDKTINEGKQDKHIKGSNNYIEGRSYLTISKEEAQSLVNKYAGTGEVRITESKKWSKQEIISTDKIIGVSVSKINGEHKTNSFKIHYSKTGTHIVPFWKE